MGSPGLFAPVAPLHKKTRSFAGSGFSTLFAFMHDRVLTDFSLTWKDMAEWAAAAGCSPERGCVLRYIDLGTSRGGSRHGPCWVSRGSTQPPLPGALTSTRLSAGPGNTKSPPRPWGRGGLSLHALFLPKLNYSKGFSNVHPCPPRVVHTKQSGMIFWSAHFCTQMRSKPFPGVIFRTLLS